MPSEPTERSLATLLEKASQVASGRRLQDQSFLPALELLVRSCEETAALSPGGRRVLSSIVVRHLVNRLLLEAEVEAGHAGGPIGPMVVVTGLPRTGTTVLHNLLALDPGSRSLRLWEALRPVPPRDGSGPSQADLVARAATWLDRLYELVPDFRAIHAATAEGPEECDALLQNDFASQHFDDMFDAQAYSAWLATASLRAEYRSYARQLRVLNQGGTRPWILKSPSHLGHLDALLEACPEAMILHCHRSPAEAVPSYASLVLCLRRAYSERVLPELVGRQALWRCETAMNRCLAVRRAQPERFIDVEYRDLLERPLTTVEAVYDQLGRAFPPELPEAVTTWLSRHPQHGHGVHRYDRESFGLSEASLRQAFGPYFEQIPAGAS